VYSFEPLPQNAGYLKRHLELNRISNCTVYEQAVSDECGPARFSGSGSVGHLNDSGIVVQTVTLDALVSSGNIRVPSVIKCDIEGAEYRALLGARFVLSHYRPAIFVATHGAKVHDQCCNFLSGLGYKLQTIDGAAVETSHELVAR
jgi:FkbM family methyltransferase